MNANFACQNAPSSAIRLGSFRHVTNGCRMVLLALLALLCGMGASVQAQTASYGGSTSVFDAADFAAPQGMATDSSGDLFIASNGTTPTVYERTRTGPGTYSAPVALPAPSPNYVSLKGVAIDSNGNLWVADFANSPTTNGQVYELVYNPTSKTFATPVAVGTGWKSPWQITADASGNVFVTDNSATTITEISGGTATVVNTGGVSGPRGIAVDSTENLYVVDSNLGQVMKLVPPYTTVASVNMNSGFQGPGDIALDGNGNIWVAAYSANLAREMTFSSGYQTILNFGSGLSGPLAVWPDAEGNMLVSDDGDHAIKQITTGAISVGTVAVGSPSVTQSLAFTFESAGTIAAPAVLTQGVASLDFIDAGTGTCTTNGIAHSYAQGDTCTVDVTLKPKHPGVRYGAVELRNTSGNVLATALVYGIGQGPQVVFPSNTTTTTLGSAFSQPRGVAVDGSGNVYVADSGNNVVKEMVAAGGYTTVNTLGSGFSDPKGVAVDGGGNVYVADTGNNAVDEIVAAGGYTTVTKLGTGFTFSSPTGVAVDGSGNVYVADNGDSAVYEMSAGCGESSCVTALGSVGSFGSAAGVAVDGSGNVYVTGSGSVKEILAAGGYTTVNTLGSGFNTPIGVAVDGSGNVYVGDYGTNLVDEMPPGCADSSCVTVLGSDFNAPTGVALDESGNLYTSDSGNSAVKEVNLAAAPSLSFATTNMGSQSSDSPQTVMVRNIGNASLTFPVPGTGTNPSVSASFTLDGSTTCPEVTTSSSVGTLAAGASCQLGVDFLPRTIGQISGAVVLSDNNLNASPAATQRIGLSGAAGTQIDPWIRVNNGAWQEGVTSVTVNAGDTVDFGPRPLTGGSWSWSGPNFSSTSRDVYAVPLTSATNVFTATYTNTAGVTSTQAFTITINPTPIQPWLRVNNGVWQQGVTSVAVNEGDTVDFGPRPLTGGSWSWSGPSFSSTSRDVYAVPLTLHTNVFTATYTNADGAQSTQAFTITVNPTPIVPYLRVNNGAWQQGVTSVAVNEGDTVDFGPRPLTGGSWSWTGPSFSSSSRDIYAVPLTLATNVFTATYTNAEGAQSTQTFTVTVNPTPIEPWVQVNNGVWQQGVSSVTVNEGDTVNLGPRPLTGGSWSWSGPSFTSSSRDVYAVPLTLPTNVFTATYTNAEGAQSTQAFTVIVNPTPIQPWLQVNNGPWQQGVSSVTVNEGDKVNFGPRPLTGGSWSWSGPNFSSTSRDVYAVPLTLPTNVFTATYTNTAGVTSTQAFTVTVNPTPIVPWLQVNNGPWQQGVSSVAVNEGDTVNFGPRPLTGGSWSWSGPNFSSTSRDIYAVPLTSATNVFTATYTNTAGVTSTQAFTITINPTPIQPWLRVNNGVWQQGVTSVAVNEGDTVDFGPRPLTGGSWSWSGPSFSSTSRDVYAVPLTLHTNVFTATYTNADGAQSTQAFTITVNPTPIVPYLRVNNGAWQQGVTSVAVNEGDTVDFGPRPLTGGSWSWTGPSFSSSSRDIYAVPLTLATNVFTATYTNAEGAQSTQTFTVTVNPTPIEPWVQVNNGVWQQGVSSVTVNEGDTVNLGPRPLTGGSWSWTGPNMFSSTSRALYGISLAPGSNVYTATYSNAEGAKSTQNFIITVNN